MDLEQIPGFGRGSEQDYVSGRVMAVLFSFGLALAYVLFGMGLKGKGVDGYAFGISLVLGSLYGLHYFLRTDDVSETLGFFVTLFWALYLGLEDLFVYFICTPLGKCGVPAKLPWLNSPNIIGSILGLIGVNTVTFPALVYLVYITGIIVYVVTWALRYF